MRVFLGSDHAGFDLKAKVAARLRQLGYEAVDCGPTTFDPHDDYPPYCFRAAESAVAEPGSLAVVVGGSGNGETIAANKVRGARCILAWNEASARLGREHNNANVLALGARLLTEEDALRLVEIFVATPCGTEERHLRRIAMIAAYEGSNEGS